MSSGLECEFVKVDQDHTYSYADGSTKALKKGWYYHLQNWTCPAGCMDWRDDATAYGPYDTEDIAHEHLSNHHSNPGGYWTSKDPSEDLLKTLAFNLPERNPIRNPLWISRSRSQ